MIKKITNLFKSDFGKNILTLGSGTVLAQIVPFLFYPIIARIFTPAEMGFLATITAIFVLIAIVASGKYELGILVAKTKKDAAHLAVLSVLLSFCISIFIYIVLQLFFLDILSEKLHEPNLTKWLFICPVAAFSVSVFTIYNEWCVKNGYFKRLSVNKITNSIFIVSGKLFLGIVKIFSQGLVIGDVTGRVFSAGACIFKALQKDFHAFKEISFVRMKQLAKEFIEFPKFILPARLLNELGKQLPIFFLGFYFSSTEVGYYAMATLVLYSPVVMISSAIRDVFRQRANEYYQKSGSCRRFYLKNLKTLSIVAVLGSVTLIFCLPFIFSIFVGNQWDTAAYYAQILTIPTFLSFISAPLFDVIIIANKLKYNFLWHLFYVLIACVGLWIGAFFYHDVVIAILFLAIGTSLAHLLSIFLSFHFSKGV